MGSSPRCFGIQYAHAAGLFIHRKDHDMKWSREYSVNVNDTDANNIVSASALLRFMQDAADRAMAEDKPSFDDLLEKGLTFILSRLSLSSYSPIRAHDTIVVETWACESKGVQFDRCFRILRDGVIMAEAVSVWALCGVNDRRLHRFSEIESHYRTDAMLELDLPTRLKIPDDVGLKLRGERIVEYADIDVNGHMNNTRYPDVLCGFLDTSMKGNRVISLVLSFIGEAPLGESVKYYSGVSDGGYYVRSIRGDGKTNVEAEIMLEAI